MNEIEELKKKNEETHDVWRKFCVFITEKFGGFKGLYGYDVMEAIEEYVKGNQEIKLTWCDDDHFCSSLIVIVPHKDMGNTVLFIPQCTAVSNMFFLYPGHQKSLIETLNEVTHKDPMDEYRKP